jgi:hypothetical protein
VTSDRQRPGGWEREHRYGPAVHVLDNVYLLTALARLSGLEVRHPEMTCIVRDVYRALMMTVAGQEFPRIAAEVPTRMARDHAEAGVYRGEVLDPRTQVVIVDVVRAGIVPAQTCFELLCSVLPDEHVRLDHLTMARVSNAAGEVTGVDLSGSKIGGSVEGSILLLPDPMDTHSHFGKRVLYRYHISIDCFSIGTGQKVLE